jgi:uncharacterized protein
MAFEWDEKKRQANLVKHGVDFRRMPEPFDGGTVERVDGRQDYGETRINCLGEIDRRIISARKANAREQKTYYARVDQ